MTTAAYARHRADGESSRLRKFRPDIEGIRFIMILMVVVHHLNFPVFGGVDASMALSGFLGATIVTREFTERGRFSFGRFYASRARRLLPLATIVIVATLVAAKLWLPAFKLKAVAMDALFAAGFGINYRLAVGQTDYFTEGADTSPLQHYWSLSVEEQYYFLLPVFLVTVMWLMRRFRLGTWPLVVALVLLTAGSMYLSVTTTEVSQPWAYFSAHTRIWEFGFGALTAVGAQMFSRMWQPLAALVSWTGLAMLLGGSFMIAKTSEIPGWVMIWPVLGTCLFIAGGCAAPKYGAEAVIANGVFRFFGRASYGWYLWHWPVLLIMPYAFGYRRTVMVDAIVAVGALALAVGTYYAVERPVKAWRPFVDMPMKGIALGVRCAAVSVAAAIVLLTSVVVRPDLGVAAVAYAEPSQVATLVQNAAKVTSLSPKAAAGLNKAKDGLYTNCLADEAASTARSCNMGDYGGGKQIVLLGSSLAWQWIAPVDTIAQRWHAKLAIFTKGVCPAEKYSVDVRDYMAGGNVKAGAYTQCDAWRNDAYNKAAALHPQLVIMSSHLEAQATPDAITESVSFFSSLGAKVVVIGETPRFDFDVPECLTTPGTAFQSCGTSPRTVYPDPERGRMAVEAVRQGGGVTIDPLPWLCTDTVCPPVVDDKLVYRDRTHLSPVYATWLTTALQQRLPSLG